MKKILIYLVIGIIFFTAGWFLKDFIKSASKSPKTVIQQIRPRPLDKYTIENLSQKTITPTEIKIERLLKEEKSFTTYLFSISFDPTLENKTQKKVTGVLNIPAKGKNFPLVLMLRGFVDQKTYTSGTGTKRAAEFFAQKGFITVAPDFLGYGESDKESENIFESRFQTYTTVLTLLSSFGSPSFTKATEDKWDNKNIFLWGHSNGGQIALTVLEITGKSYPTTLWAPVSKPFPYSILYYTDESEDLGKLIRKELAKFEEDYDVNLYSIHNYFGQIHAPIQIHQGTADDAVPVDWTKKLVKNLKSLDLDIDLYLHIGADHNLQPSWNTVVTRDLKFFNANLN
jgi:alpha-beta hydrolase superfamily lysophospholipase